MSEVVHQFEWSATLPSVAVVLTIAAAADREPTDIGPFYGLSSRRASIASLARFSIWAANKLRFYGIQSGERSGNGNCLYPGA
jgi:hypothetical protein